MFLYLKNYINFIENSRPITFINNFSKAFVFALYKAIFSDVKNMIIEKQHGFMKVRYIIPHLVPLTQFIGTIDAFLLKNLSNLTVNFVPFSNIPKHGSQRIAFYNAIRWLPWFPITRIRCDIWGTSGVNYWTYCIVC